MKVANRDLAWQEVNKIFPTDYEKDYESSARAGYDIYRHRELNYYSRICDLGDRLEVLTGEWGENVTNIWIGENTADKTEQEAVRKETGRRIQRLAYWYMEEYVKELENKKREDAAIEEMQAAPDTGEIKCMVLAAENNAKVMMNCITECIRAVNILKNVEEDVDDWMLAGINAMLNKTNETRVIPFDMPTAICGLLCAQFRNNQEEESENA